MEGRPEMIVGLFGNNQLFLDGFVYHQRHTNATTINWRCVQRKKFKCGGKVTTSNDELYSNILNSTPHSHPADEFIKKKTLIRMKMRKMVEENPDLGVAKVIAEVLKDLTEEEKKKLGCMASIQRDLRKVKTDMKRLKTSKSNISVNSQPNSKKSKSNFLEQIAYKDAANDEECSNGSFESEGSQIDNDSLLNLEQHLNWNMVPVSSTEPHVNIPEHNRENHGNTLSSNTTQIDKVSTFHESHESDSGSQLLTFPQLEAPNTHSVAKLISMVEQVSHGSRMQHHAGFTEAHGSSTSFFTPRTPMTLDVWNATSLQTCNASSHRSTKNISKLPNISAQNQCVDSKVASQLHLNSMSSSMKRARKSASTTEVDVDENTGSIERSPLASTSKTQYASSTSLNDSQNTTNIYTSTSNIEDMAPEISSQDDLEFGAFEKQMSYLATPLPTVEMRVVPEQDLEGVEAQTITTTDTENQKPSDISASNIKIKSIDSLQNQTTSEKVVESNNKESSHIDNSVKKLECAIERLESVSNMLTAVSLRDSYDHFAIYISSVLRGLPARKVHVLKQKIMSEVMVALTQEEAYLPSQSQAGSPSSNYEYAPDQIPATRLRTSAVGKACMPVNPSPLLRVPQVPISDASALRVPSQNDSTSTNPLLAPGQTFSSVNKTCTGVYAPKPGTLATCAINPLPSKSQRGWKRKKPTATITLVTYPSPSKTPRLGKTSDVESNRDDQSLVKKYGSQPEDCLQIPEPKSSEGRKGKKPSNTNESTKNDESDFEITIEEGDQLAKIKQDQDFFETDFYDENSSVYIKEEVTYTEEAPDTEEVPDTDKPPDTEEVRDTEEPPAPPPPLTTCHLCNTEYPTAEDLTTHLSSAHAEYKNPTTGVVERGKS